MRGERPRRVLVIAGTPARERVRDALSIDPFELVEADGPSGIEAARGEMPELILLGDGFEVIRRLKDDPRTRPIPVIVLCGVGEVARGFDLGAADVLPGRFEPIELRARVRAALRSKDVRDLLEQRAHLDALTGLGNRHALADRLVSVTAGETLAVVVADLDRFKQVNDRRGHAAGDAVLVGAAQALRDAVGEADFVARHGGEEFVIVAPGRDLAGGVALAERCRGEVAGRSIVYEGKLIPITASFGVASGIVDDPEGAEELLARADLALYAAKAGGRDAVRTWDGVRDGKAG